MSAKSAVAWYRRNQWDRLLELAADSAELEPTYDEWLEMATKALMRIDPLGDQTCQMDVDVEELWRWCQSHDRPLDASARAAYVAQKARDEDADERPPRGSR